MAVSDALRAELLDLLAIRPCHVTGEHDPAHTPHYVCGIQKTAMLNQLLAAAGLTYPDLRRELHNGCAHCDENRPLAAWANVVTTERAE